MKTFRSADKVGAADGKQFITQISLADTGRVQVVSTPQAAAAPKFAKQKGDTLLFRSGSSSLRILSVVAFAFAIGGAMLATLLLDRTTHLAHTVPFSERVVWAGLLFSTFTGFFLAVWMYEKRVAARLILLSNGRDLRLTTPTLFGMEEHDFPVKDVLDSVYHEGDRAGEEALSSSYLHVKVRGRPSFVVSLNGVIPNREQLLRVLSTQH